jgi:restriction endonuclease Mrr
MVHEMLETIDHKFTQTRLDCEKASHSKFRHPWSPKLRDASLAINYWNTWLSQKKQKKDLRHARLRYVTQDTEEYETDQDHSLEFIKFKLSQAQRRLHSVQERAEELRQIFLGDKARMYAEEGTQGLESIVRRIIHHEQQNKIFQKLKWIRGKSLSGGIDYIIDTDNNGQEHIIQDPEAIFASIIRNNISHFSQADATEPTREPIKSILGPFGTSETCDEILNGTFCIEEVDCSNAAKAILRQLKQSSMTQINDTILSTDLQHGYRKWGEFTSTSPSGLHLSHDRAVLRYKESQCITAEATGKPTLCDRIFGIKAKLLQFAIDHCHVYQRWTKVVNAMIEKIPGKQLLNKLRVIHLIESDFNLLIGILWGRRLVHHREINDQFDEGQGGSRPDRRTQELLLQKHLMYSIWRLGKINGTSFDNDAKSCFDRIVMPLASIASQQIGMTKKACNLFLSTVSQMQYHIKTSAGISTDFYTSTANYTIHGPGQGGRDLQAYG